eukprot:PhM_4_TR15166/c0_g1_i1/m.15469
MRRFLSHRSAAFRPNAALGGVPSVQWAVPPLHVMRATRMGSSLSCLSSSLTAGGISSTAVTQMLLSQLATLTNAQLSSATTVVLMQSLILAMSKAGTMSVLRIIDVKSTTTPATN